MSNIKQLFCNHKSQRCLTTIDSNYIHNLKNGHKLNKSTWQCNRCGKIIYKNFHDSDMNILNYINRGK